MAFHRFFQLLTDGQVRESSSTPLERAPFNLKASKIAKFESDLLKTNEDIAPQSREILQTFVWWKSLLIHFGAS